jgi:hypothetical protein
MTRLTNGFSKKHHWPKYVLRRIVCGNSDVFGWRVQKYLFKKEGVPGSPEGTCAKEPPFPSLLHTAYLERKIALVYLE